MFELSLCSKSLQSILMSKSSYWEKRAKEDFGKGKTARDNQMLTMDSYINEYKIVFKID